MASDRSRESLLSDVQQVFPVSVHTSRDGREDTTTPDDPGETGRTKTGYSLRQARKRSFAEFNANDSDSYPYSAEEDNVAAPRRNRPVHPLLDFSITDDRPHKFRVRNWTHPETKSLLAIWGDPDVQNQLKNSVHNNWIWERISVLIGQRHPEFHPPRSAAQCKERLTYLRKQYRKSERLRARGKWPNVGSIKIYLDEIHDILAKRPTATVKQTPSAQPTPYKTEDDAPASSNSQGNTPGTPHRAQGAPVPSLPDLPDSDQDDDDDEDDDDGDLDETEGDDIQDFFGQNQGQDVEIDFSAEMTENNDNKTGDPLYTTFSPAQATDSARSKKRPASNQQNNSNKRPRGRPRMNPPPRDDMTVAQAITDAVMRFIDHQSYHLTEQNKLLQRYLKFERARMRWEMDMEARRMKWEEEREMREEERRQRQEELETKRVSENREFLLQMAVVLGGGGATAEGKDASSAKE